YSMHSIDKTRNGCKQGKCETDEEYEKNLTEDLKKLQNKIYEYTNYMPNTFTYPFGAISNTSKKIIKKIGFKASLSCEEGINKISKDKDCLFKLKRCIRTSEESTWEFFKKIFEYSKT
ncbi:MAG: polysaccharide deacetylase family protein, partial [Clostridia bacterium]|nr:polysaccharide deacetylase family protein [Clostridia bacterium]